MNEILATYPAGHEGIMAFGLEAGMLASNATVLPAAPAPLTLGYASTPSLKLPENTRPVRAVGTARPVGFVKGRREPVVSGSFLMSDGDNCLKFLNAALRYSSATAIPADNRSGCMPVVAVYLGYASPCNPLRKRAIVARFGMLSMLKIALQMGEVVSCQFEHQALTAQTAIITAPGEAAILAAGGGVFTMNHAYFQATVGSATEDIHGIIESATITVQNGVDRRGTHHENLDDDSDPISRIARALVAMGEDLSLELGLSAPLPYTPDSLVIVLDNGVKTITITISGLELSETSENETSAEAAFSYGATLLPTQISIVGGNSGA